MGIVPAQQHRERARLWQALEAAYPVRFEGRDADALRNLDAIVAFGTTDVTDAGKTFGISGEAFGMAGEAYGISGETFGVAGEAFGMAGEAYGISGETFGVAGETWRISPKAEADMQATDIPLLSLEGEEFQEGMPRPLVLTADHALARPLRGALLSDDRAGALRSVRPDEAVLGTLGGTPAWTRAQGTRHQRVACAPAELGAEEALRERLRPGRCLALLALAHFLADITAPLRAPPAQLRAAFVIDDPNLRRPRYGHLDYAELLHDARRHGYHLSVAMVPLDGRRANPRAVGLFHEGAAHLSLCVHGNDHDGPELGRPHTDDQALTLVAQAVRRTLAFERRTGLAVDRVMVPPHERLSEPVARALRACGFQAIATTRPYPWLADTHERSWLERPADAGPLAAWGPIDVVAGGLPVLLRADFDRHPREDLVLRAFLGQPLILYGHHDLLAAGPGALAKAAAAIARLGDVRWCSLGAIAQTAIPNGATLDPDALAAIPAPRRRLTPILRRALSEGRDRITPVRGPTTARGGWPRSWSAQT